MSSPTGSSPDVGVVLAAAGAGVRAAGRTEGVAPKQFREIAGVPMLLRALRPFASHPDVAHVVIVLSPPDVRQPPAWLVPLVGGRLALVPGGAERVDSVRAGLAALPPAVRVVLVHDAARPFVSRDTIDAVIARARAGVGAAAAVPASDTMKEVTAERRVTRTVPRAGLWRAQTPQGFPRAMLEAAYARLMAAGEGPPPTDDAEVCERAGFPVEVVPDSTRNFKVTTAEDFRVAEALAREFS